MTVQERKGSFFKLHISTSQGPTNDNFCVTKLQARLLAGSSPPSQTIDSLNVKPHVVSNVHTAPGHSQKRELSPRSAGCYYKDCKLKSVKSVSCVTQLSYAQPVTNV